MSKVCDHKSVGMLVEDCGKILLIERANPPFGFALPAGHVDLDKNFEDAAKRELKEETALEVVNLELIGEGRKENICRRENGSWHYWKIYKVITKGRLNRSKEETKKIGWYDLREILKLAERTEKYLSGEISENDWVKDPGLEPVMLDWFKEFDIFGKLRK